MTTRKENQIEELLNNFDNQFEQISQNYSITSENKIDEEDVIKKAAQIITKVANMHDIKPDHALIGVCAILQSGGYLKNVENRKITIDEVTFNKKEILLAAEQSNSNYTLRTIARCLRSQIATIAKKYEIPGHLYAQFRLENPNILSIKDPNEQLNIAAYCTDFHLDNPEAPQIVHDFLTNRAKNRIQNQKKR